MDALNGQDHQSEGAESFAHLCIHVRTLHRAVDDAVILLESQLIFCLGPHRRQHNGHDNQSVQQLQWLDLSAEEGHHVAQAVWAAAFLVLLLVGKDFTQTLPFQSRFSFGVSTSWTRFFKVIL